MDGLIAATAQVHGLTLVTRNPADFQLSVKSVLNPWRSALSRCWLQGVDAAFRESQEVPDPIPNDHFSHRDAVSHGNVRRSSSSVDRRARLRIWNSRRSLPPSGILETEKTGPVVHFVAGSCTSLRVGSSL